MRPVADRAPRCVRCTRAQARRSSSCAREASRRLRASGEVPAARCPRWYGRVSSGGVSDRSFIRFGGLAGILLAITSWAAVVVYYTVAQGGQDVVGIQIFQFFYFLIALWALFGIVAVYWVIRAQGEAWSFFATLIGAIASVGTMTSALYQIASTRAMLAVPPNIAKDL